MKYISAAQVAKKWGISAKRVQVLCRHNRIQGVMRIGNMWAIPTDSEKPKDSRIRSGKYIGFAEKYRKSD